MGFDQFAFGKRFKELRKERKLTQEQLADRLGISDRHVRGIEHGDFFPSIDLYILIAQVFQVSLDVLILGEISSSREIELKEHLHNQEVLIQKLKEVTLPVFLMKKTVKPEVPLPKKDFNFQVHYSHSKGLPQKWEDKPEAGGP